MNLRKMVGSYKGLIGEAMFAASNSGFILTRFHPKWKYLARMNISEDQRDFLTENWYSIDSVSYDGSTVIEIKTRNKYQTSLPYKPKASEHSVNLLQKAKMIGFKVLIATVWFEDDWEYSVALEEFSVSSLSIDKPKSYDWGT